MADAHFGFMHFFFIYLGFGDLQLSQEWIIEKFVRLNVDGALALAAVAERPVGVDQTPEGRT